MEIFNFFVEVIRRELQKFNVSIDPKIAKEITAATANDINYDIVYNRVAYLLRCGAVNVSFMSECLSSFVMNYSDIASLICKWNNSPSMTLSSITKGPGIEYIAFLLTWGTYIPSTPLFKTINIVTKYGAWRNTVNIMQQLLTEPNFTPQSNVLLGDVNVIQGDPVLNLSNKIKVLISDSDVVVMIKSLNGEIDSDIDIRKNLLAMLCSLKPGTIFVCIETKPIAAEIMKLLSAIPGKYLCGPTPMVLKLDFDCPDEYKTFFGCAHINSARGAFFVWEKSVDVPPVNTFLESAPDGLYNSGNSSSQNVDLENFNCVSLKGNTMSSPTQISSNIDTTLSNSVVRDFTENHDNSNKHSKLEMNRTSLFLDSKVNTGINKYLVDVNTSIKDVSFSTVTKKMSNSYSDLEDFHEKDKIPSQSFVSNYNCPVSKNSQCSEDISSQSAALTVPIDSENSCFVPTSKINTPIQSSLKLTKNNSPPSPLLNLNARMADSAVNSYAQIQHPLSNNCEVVTTAKEQGKKVNVDSNLTYVNQSIQSFAPRDQDQINAVKISALTHQVTELTQAIRNMLEADSNKSCSNGNETKEKFISEHCSCCSKSHTHDYDHPRSHLSSIKGQHGCHVQHSFPNNCASSNAFACPCYRYECKCCDQTISPGNKFTSVQTPNLVIPLNYLSEDTISQILKSLSTKTKTD